MPKNTTQCPQPGLEPGLLDQEMNALTMRPLCLPQLEENKPSKIKYKKYVRRRLKGAPLCWQQETKGNFVFTADYLKVIERIKQVIKIAGKKVLLM